MYKPIQILKNEKIDEKINYFEINPRKELDKYVACYWILKSKNKIENKVSHRVLPDGCIDIIVDFNDFNSNIVGIMDNSINVPISGEIFLLGIRFLPKSIPYILKYESHNIVNKSYKTEELSSDLKTLTEKLFENMTIIETIKEIENKLILFFYNYDINKSFEDILNMVLLKQGQVSVKELSQYFFISEKQITRKFKNLIGLSTKEFINIIRFQSLLNSINTNNDKKINWNELALKTGYYDQAHLINDFKKFFGDSPEKILK